jgi:hypothetical protein
LQDEESVNMKARIIMVCMAGLLPFALAQNPAPPRIGAADAKTYVGKKATVCGKVVDTQIRKNALLGYGFPVSFDLDQPQTDPVFYFVAFGKQDQGPQEVVEAYQGKRVCVTGKIDIMPSGGPPFILVPDRSKIKPDAAGK